MSTDATNKDVAIDNDHSVSALWDTKEQIVHIASVLHTDTLSLDVSQHPPKVINGLLHCKGLIREEEHKPLKDEFLKELTPYLQNKVKDDTEVLELADLEFQIDAGVDAPKGKFHGRLVEFQELRDGKGNYRISYHLIGFPFSAEDVDEVRSLRVTKFSALTLGENTPHKNRPIALFTDLESAGKCLRNLQTFPPYKDNRFYAEARPIAITELEEYNLKDEQFVIYDHWKLLLLNLTDDTNIVE
jgi:hypothetical protein